MEIKEEEKYNLLCELKSLCEELIEEERNKGLYIDICHSTNKLILQSIYKENGEIILCTNVYDLILEDLTFDQLYDLYEQIVLMF